MKLRMPKIRLRRATGEQNAGPGRQRGPVGESKAWAALSMAWMAITLSATNYLDPGPTRVLPPALQAAVTTIGLWRPVPYAGLFAAIAGSILYSVAGILSRFGLDAFSQGSVPVSQQAALAALLTAAPGFVTVCLALLGSGWLAESLATKTDRDEVQRRHDQRLIEDLVPTHGETGLLKWSYAERTLGQELDRARRYGHSVALALIARADLEPSAMDLDTAAVEQASLATALREVVRPSDLLAVYKTGELAVALPHTPLAGAMKVSEKLREQAGKVGVAELKIGVAEFPHDGADVEELCAEAQHALAFARDTGLSIVSRTLLT